ncbi:hypothetical protein [Saliniradius amylolyticus]|nr:hypothetical protein [Saliniradius amylolyticus]
MSGPLLADVVSFVDFTSLYKNPNNRYFIELLDKAMQASQERYGTYKLQPLQIHITQSRQLKELNKGTIDVFWSVATERRESQVLAVNFPLIKGAYGIRLLVVNMLDKDRFESVDSLAALRLIPILVGRDWPDAELLMLHGFNLDTSIEDRLKYQSLSVRGNKLYPRGLFEAMNELDEQSFSNLTILQRHVICYPQVVKYFVAKHNRRLSDRLLYGLKRLKESGEFDRFFAAFPAHKNVLEHLVLRDSMLHRLSNPYLPASVDIDVVQEEQNQLLQLMGQ